MLIDTILERARRRAPHAPALHTPRGSLTFAELGARVERLAGALSAHARPGDRVALLSENRSEVVECYYGAPRAGTVLVPLNWRLAPSELGELLADSEPRVLIGERSHLERISGHMPASVATIAVLDDGNGSGAAGEGYEALLASATGASGGRSRGSDHAAWIVYTSGTTGRAKGAVLTHSNVWAGVVTGSLGRPVLPGDVYLFPFPLCHIAGYNVLVQHLHGRPVVLPGRFDPKAVWRDVERHGVTTMSLAPTMLAMLLDHGGRRSADISTLRSVSYGASAIPAVLLERSMRELGCGFSQGYGMTELAGNVAFLGPELHRRGLASEPRLLAAAGYPSPFVDLRVADEEGRDVTRGELGEVLVRGDQVTAGYWRSPAATVDAFAPGGWFRTGDIGRMDPDGLLTIVDRRKDLIVTGGENVSSLEVEDVLHRHPAVAAVAVVAVPDEMWGEAICAVVVPAAGAEPGDGLAEELVGHCRAALASFKKPRHVVFVDELPRNAGGKVLKAKLRDRLQRRWAGR